MKVIPPHVRMELGTSDTINRWCRTLRRSYQIPDFTPFILPAAVYIANRYNGIPVWLLLVGPGSCGKSTALKTLDSLPHVVDLGDFTRASLLSASSSKDKTAESHGGVLLKIGLHEGKRWGMLRIGDMTTILSKGHQEVQATLGSLQEVYDGRVVRNTGMDMGKTVSWEGKVGLVGATTQIIDHHHKALTAAGSRMLFYRYPDYRPHERLQTARAIHGIFSSTQSATPPVNENPIESYPAFDAELPNEVIVDIAADTKALVKSVTALYTPTTSEISRLIACANVATIARSDVQRDHKNGGDIEAVTSESAIRFGQQLSMIFGALISLGVGKRQAWLILREVMLGSMPIENRRLLLAMDWVSRFGTSLASLDTALAAEILSIDEDYLSSRDYKHPSSTNNFDVASIMRVDRDRIGGAFHSARSVGRLMEDFAASGILQKQKSNGMNMYSFTESFLREWIVAIGG